MNNKDSFTGKLGFVLAAAGSAVGLGNIWRFPYIAAKYGGGIFLIIYIFLALTVGSVIMLSEIAIGRKTGLSVLEAYKALDRRFSFLGTLGTIIAAIVLSYYSVIGGWIIKYLFEFCQGNIPSTVTDGFFSTFISQSWSPLFYFSVFLCSTAGIIYLGVKKGIEKFSKILMPVLAILTIFIGIYSCFLPGAKDGLIYYIKPDLQNISPRGTILSAMCQMFYSLSLAMGVMITYGSYVKKESNLERSATLITLIDTGIAFFAGLMVIPAVFAFMGEDSLNAGPGLIFITLPKVFNSMKSGRIIGIMFFLLVFFAALTSAISLMETVVASIQDKSGMTRKKSLIMTILISAVLGSLSSLGNGVLGNIRIIGMDFLSFFDYITNNILMLVLALLTCIFVGYVIKPETLIKEIELSATFRKKKIFVPIIKYIAPVFIIIILIYQFI